jgi:hypothetical protein
MLQYFIFASILLQIYLKHSQLVFTCFRFYFTRNFFNSIRKSFSLLPLHLICQMFNTIRNRIDSFPFFIEMSLTVAVFMHVALLVFSLYFQLFLACHIFWESRSFHTSHNSQVRIVCTCFTAGFSRHLHVYLYIHIPNFLHYSTQTTALFASHTYWKL